MKLLGGLILIGVFLIVGIVVGVAANMPLVMMGSFCSLFPTTWMMGYATYRAGISITINSETAPARRVVARKDPRGDF